MFEELTYERFKKLAEKHKRIAVYKEIPGDRLTPISAYLALNDDSNSVTLLESSPKEKTIGRFSHLCFEPLVLIESTDQQVTIQQTGKPNKQLTADPFDVLRQYQKDFFIKTDHPLSGFIGGLVGFISYDAIRLVEDIPDSNDNNDNIPDLLFRCYANNITFDHQTGKIIISTLAEVKGDPKAAYDQAIEKITQLSQQLFTQQQNQPSKAKPQHNETNITTNVDDQNYCQMVQQAKQYIIEGDIFQVVPSRQFCMPITAGPFEVYRALRFSNPSPYMFYLETPSFTIAGASPEKLISIRNGVVESCPLAGTRPRDPKRDDEIAAELLSNEKEVAEHMMLVDLARNDVGSISNSGSVKVSKLKEIEKYSRVMHISSTVEGQLRTDKDVFDALKAAMPAGTLSGAPKIRAMEIIDELESTRRGVYGGTICGIDSQGNLESCIAIRMAIIKDGTATVRAGGGVVYDSDPQAEANETRHKAQAILEGILLAERGIA